MIDSGPIMPPSKRDMYLIAESCGPDNMKFTVSKNPDVEARKLFLVGQSTTSRLCCSSSTKNALQTHCKVTAVCTVGPHTK